MQQLIELTSKAGKRQKCLLLELERQAIICLNRENGMWMRGALTCKLAKDLLLPTDKTIDEQIKDIEPFVLRNEADAKRLGVKLQGYGREKLNKLYEKRYQMATVQITIDERLDIIQHLTEINITCIPNLEDIRYHIAQIKAEREKPVVIYGEPLRQTK